MLDSKSSLTTFRPGELGCLYFIAFKIQNIAQIVYLPILRDVKNFIFQISINSNP